MMGQKKKTAVLDELFSLVGIYRNETDFRELFKFIRRFPRVSPFNSLLLHIQKPGSSFVATAHVWNKEFNRDILPWARPLVLLKPFGPVQFVFDLIDTVGEDPFPKELLNPFAVEGTISPRDEKNLLGNIQAEGISIHKVENGSGSAGRIKRVKNEKGIESFQIILNKNHSAEISFTTIVHEAAHYFCGHLGAVLGEKASECMEIKDRGPVNSTQMEFEAESVSWLVCSRKGIGTKSVEYLAGYITPGEPFPDISIETVLRVAGLIEAMMDTFPYKKKRMRKVAVETERI